MSEIRGPDGLPFSEPERLIETDSNGDLIRQGSLMSERQSYERVIEGLKIAADACMHLSKREITPEATNSRRHLALLLDQCRRICVQHAGIDDVIRVRPTEEARGEPLRWREARDRLLEGLRQASGGARQLATCFRIDLMWSNTARQLESLEESIRNPKRMRHSNPMLLPTGYVRH